MDIEFIMKVAGIGIIVTVVTQVLSKAGRDEQATLVSIAGIVVVLLMLITGLSELFELVREVFGLCANLRN